MEVVLAVTKTCHHCPILEQELKRLGVPYRVQYCEDHPEITKKHCIKRSPVILVDDRVVLYGMPSIQEPEQSLPTRKMPSTVLLWRWRSFPS